MNSKCVCYSSIKSSLKIAFILIFVPIISIVLFFSSCAPKKKNKTKKPIQFSLPQYPLTTYHIEVDQDSLDYIYTHFSENIYLTVNVQIGDTYYEGVKLRIRGDSSREYDKKSLKLKLAKGDKLDDGARKINLNADYIDKTMMHQYLSSYTMNKNGQICFRSGYAPVYINDDYFGLYIRVENMDSTFLKARNLSKKNSLYKATKDYACLVSPSEVDHLWEKKSKDSDGDYDDLKDLIIDLNDVPMKDFELFARSNFFYDEIVNIIALNLTLSNSSTYYHNYYMYHDIKKEKWRMFPWDMDKTFNPDQINYNYQKTSWAEGKSSAIHTNTLVEKFLTNPASLEAINKRIIEIKENFNQETYSQLITNIKHEISDYVLMDKSDRIGGEKHWTNRIEKMLVFIDQRSDSLVYQIANKPHTFMVNPMVEVNDNSATIEWDKANDPNSLALTYTLHYSANSSFKDTITYKIDNLSSNTITIKDLKSGKYFFFVEASNGKYNSYGHNIRNSFEIP